MCVQLRLPRRALRKRLYEGSQTCSNLSCIVIGTLCDTSDCNGKGQCIGTKDSFTCLCNVGYVGHRCESRLGIDGLPSGANKLCETKDCNTNGYCVGSKQAPVCLCNLGFAGLRCEFGKYSLLIPFTSPPLNRQFRTPMYFISPVQCKRSMLWNSEEFRLRMQPRLVGTQLSVFYRW